MGEKRGETGKLDFNFNTAWACEVQMNNGKWYRVLDIDFRSFNGPRRVTKPIGIELGKHLGTETLEYNGPTYFYKTNIRCNPAEYEVGKIIYQKGTSKAKAERTSVAGL